MSEAEIEMTLQKKEESKTMKLRGKDFEVIPVGRLNYRRRNHYSVKEVSMWEAQNECSSGCQCLIF